MKVIPDHSLMHLIALLPERAEPRAFFEPLKARRPGFSAAGQHWQAAASPRPCAFGPLEQGPWAWHVVIDLGELPAAPWKLGFGETPMPPHKAHALVFLTRAPPTATGLERVRATLDVAWAWLEAGASALAFPSAGVAEEAKALGSMDPATLDADRAAALLIAFASMGKGADGRYWLRTRGMSQFNLPDPCCALSAQPTNDEIQEVQILFSSLCPFLIARDQAMQPGESVKLGDKSWKAAPESALKAAPAYLGKLQVFE